jgi:hypothetical protein
MPTKYQNEPNIAIVGHLRVEEIGKRFDGVDDRDS